MGAMLGSILFSLGFRNAGWWLLSFHQHWPLWARADEQVDMKESEPLVLDPTDERMVPESADRDSDAPQSIGIGRNDDSYSETG
jgi:hypothetical protein